MPDKKYSDLSDSHKVRVNGQILRALENNQPVGIITAFQDALNAASRDKDRQGMSVVRPQASIDAREKQFQSMLDAVRDKLAPYAEEFPAMPTSHVQNDLRAQQHALRAIKNAMSESGHDGTIAQVQTLVSRAAKNNSAPIAGQAHAAATAVLLTEIGDKSKIKTIACAEQSGAPQLASGPHARPTSAERTV